MSNYEARKSGEVKRRTQERVRESTRHLHHAPRTTHYALVSVRLVHLPTVYLPTVYLPTVYLPTVYLRPTYMCLPPVYLRPNTHRRSMVPSTTFLRGMVVSMRMLVVEHVRGDTERKVCGFKPPCCSNALT